MFPDPGSLVHQHLRLPVPMSFMSPPDTEATTARCLDLLASMLRSPLSSRRRSRLSYKCHPCAALATPLSHVPQCLLARSQHPFDSRLLRSSTITTRSHPTRSSDYNSDPSRSVSNHAPRVKFISSPGRPRCLSHEETRLLLVSACCPITSLSSQPRTVDLSKSQGDVMP